MIVTHRCGHKRNITLLGGVELIVLVGWLKKLPCRNCYAKRKRGTAGKFIPMDISWTGEDVRKNWGLAP